MSNGKCMRLYELLVLMSILAVFFILAARFLSASSGTIDQLNTGWSVNDGVNEYEDVDLQSFRIRKTRKGSEDELIDQMNRALEDLNRKDPSVRRSAASGYAFRHEADGAESNSVYLLADERMYKNKTEMKGRRSNGKV